MLKNKFDKRDPLEINLTEAFADKEPSKSSVKPKKYVCRVLRLGHNLEIKNLLVR
jgi:hypothetical protein